ncbi:MAG: ribosome silencing factor [Pseudomonadota bacterium]
MLNSSEDLKDFILKALDEKKAENIVVIDLENKTSFAKYMIFATGRSTKNISAIADYISMELKHHSSFKTTIEGSGASEWVLLDAGDIILHLFQTDARERYKIEELWKD